MFVFGSNKNLSLGVGDEDDRQYPERIQLRRPEHLVHMFHQQYLDNHGLATNETLPSWEDIPNLIRSTPLIIRDMVMSKLHSAILTSDPVSNLYICGVGRGGRLGLGDENTQFKYAPVGGPLADKHVQKVALGQNHTLAVTSNGELWTWGLNTESQLGYILPPPLRPDEEPMSLIPRQVFGTLKKETVLGAAASAKHSVCYTSASLFCWGQNLGQLALMDADSRSLDIQPTPRRVAASLLKAPIEMVSAVDNATICLLANHSVLVFTNYGYNSVKFPIPDIFSNQGLATSFNPYDPKRRNIHYIASGGDTIAAITARGDLFTMDLNKADFAQPGGSTTNPTKMKGVLTPPQCVWDSRKDRVVSVDVGENGSVIICTESGAVWRRIKRLKGKFATFAESSDKKRKDFKFERIPYITNCVSVRSSVFGAFAALRTDAKVMTEAIEVSEQGIWDDLAPLIPLADFVASEVIEKEPAARKAWDAALLLDRPVPICLELLRSVNIEEDLNEYLRFRPQASDLDMLITTTSTPEIHIPIHSWILAARSSTLRHAFSEYRQHGSISTREGFVLSSKDEKLVLELEADIYTLLNILAFSYLDTIIPVWRYTKEAPSLAYRFRQVRSEVMKFATKFNMPKLEASARLQSRVEKSLDSDFRNAIKDPVFFEDGDVLVQLDGDEIHVHSQLLCQRCPFFEGMFHGRSQGQWLASRRGEEKMEMVEVDLKHISPETFQFVLRYLYADVGLELFDEVGRGSLDDFCEFVVDVMAVANELMLDRLSEICQQVIGKFVNARNIANLLNEISPCSVTSFKDAGLEYVCLQLEMMLENHLLGNLDEDILQDLDEIVRDNQLAQFPLARSGRAELLLHDKYPDLICDIEEERQRRVREMAFRYAQREEEKRLPSAQKSRYGSYEETSTAQTPDRKRRKSRGNRNEPFSPLLRAKSSQAELIFDMEDEKASSLNSPFSPTLKATTPRLDTEADHLSPIPSPWQSLKDDTMIKPTENSFVTSQAADGTPTKGPLDSDSILTSKTTLRPETARPWAANPLETAKLDLKHIMSEASSTSELSVRLASQSRKGPSFGKGSGAKMSQKEKKMQMQKQAEAQAAAERDQSSQIPWEQVSSGSKPAPWKAAPGATTPKTPLKDAMLAEVADAAAGLKAEPRFASDTESKNVQRRTASPDTRFSGQNRAKNTPPSSSTQRDTAPMVPHSKSYMPPKAKAEATLGYSMADIIGQQQREQEMVKEAVAKRSLQEIQEEQAFQEWWDQESRRTQEEEARKQGRSSAKNDRDGNKSNRRGRGGKPKDATGENTNKGGSSKGPKGGNNRDRAKEGTKKANRGGQTSQSGGSKTKDKDTRQ